MTKQKNEWSQHPFDEYECGRNLSCTPDEFCCKSESGDRFCNMTRGEECFHVKDYLLVLPRRGFSW